VLPEPCTCVTLHGKERIPDPFKLGVAVQRYQSENAPRSHADLQESCGMLMPS
jgi:hypothetical protein